jgi:hypothetical protein
LAAQTRLANVAGIHSGIAPMANMESIAPNSSLLRRFKTSDQSKNVQAFSERAVRHRAASTYCIK